MNLLHLSAAEFMEYQELQAFSRLWISMRTLDGVPDNLMLPVRTQDGKEMIIPRYTELCYPVASGVCF